MFPFGNNMESTTKFCLFTTLCYQTFIMLNESITAHSAVIIEEG